MSLIRATVDADIVNLPAIERSAGEAFHQYPQWRWVADGEVMSTDEHVRLAALGTSWVAESDVGAGPGRVCGFLAAEAFAEELRLSGSDSADAHKTNVLHIWELAVHAQAQGAGLGTALMRQVIAEASSAGTFSSLTLTTFREVAFNAPFYERLGFEVLSADATSERLRLDARLRRVLASEAEHGLPAESRCAMRYRL